MNHEKDLVKKKLKSFEKNNNINDVYKSEPHFEHLLAPGAASAPQI